ncbi:hypothetical protein A2480_04490 [Candidatus Uhrbacteria bacterium RIFOXYC2_FULL_47_19]|uniref:Prepilin peptidase n=1 Tax=Candidatus Uhrbacteria bacterium RIFOXYC2_FULL_47_19 TaxID=1802424 RepID=A0A1F7WCP3_9BACT|nr:MAG: hypothetical protein A2480_04490 [Candidatus Uhrbacteria bacterium RIFOXYC2_FULL_47_19]HCC22494.1 prepilin peptidase [Candidatus Uhrbacteria bacterium]
MIWLFAFILGTAVGSFLNVVVWRLKTKKSFVRGRSHCPHCGHTLTTFDLIPLVSYLLLRGHCRHCSASISPSYFLIEVVVGFLFLLAVPGSLNGVLDWSNLLLNWFIISVLTIVFVFDLRYMLIPRLVVLPAFVLVLAANLFLGLSVWSMVLGIVVSAGFFWLQYLLSHGRWIGGGDINLGLLMGVALGFPNALAALFLAYIVGAAVGVSLLATKRSTWHDELPFGTFLSAATIVVLLYGNKLVNWYLNLI